MIVAIFDFFLLTIRLHFGSNTNSTVIIIDEDYYFRHISPLLPVLLPIHLDNINNTRINNGAGIQILRNSRNQQSIILLPAKSSMLQMLLVLSGERKSDDLRHS